MLDRSDNRDLLHTALNLRAYRQEVLASNIANADTPNYKARDIDFKSALAGALQGGTAGGALRMSQSDPRHMQAPGANAFGAALLYRTEQQPNVDGNTVNMDMERSNFAENALQMEAVLAFMHQQDADVKVAIQSV